MTIDFNSLTGLSLPLGVVHGDYDFARDGGAIGLIELPADSLPAGALPLLLTVKVTTEVAGDPNWTADLYLRGDLLGGVSIAPGASTNTIPYVTALANLAVQRTPTLVISDDALTAGVFEFWVTYIST